MKKVNITFGFGAVVCVLAWLDLYVCGRFLLAMVCHELGHLLVMYLTGATVQRIHFRAAGAVIRGEFSGYGQETICAAAGPFFSFLLGFVCMRFAPRLAMVSCLLGIANLLPIYPLDGGRILRSALLSWVPMEKADRILRFTTGTVCCLLMICACWVAVEWQAGLWPVFAALVILWRVGQAGWQEYAVAFPGHRS